MSGRAGQGGVAPRPAAPPRRMLRRHERRPAELAVTVQDAASRVRGRIRFESQDLSLGGAFLRSDLLFEVNEEVDMEFSLPHGPRVRVRGRVVHVSREREGGKGPGMGVKFMDLSDTDREAVRVYIASRS